MRTSDSPVSVKLGCTLVEPKMKLPDPAPLSLTMVLPPTSSENAFTNHPLPLPTTYTPAPLPQLELFFVLFLVMTQPFMVSDAVAYTLVKSPTYTPPPYSAVLPLIVSDESVMEWSRVATPPPYLASLPSTVNPPTDMLSLFMYTPPPYVP